MQAVMYLKIKPMPTIRTQSETGKTQDRFFGLGRWLSRSVNYYSHEELQKMGAPYRWID